ncbi:MAG TPA: maleylpyruvate isomerase N-terminal domain-containing protein [Candidatus Acidoferrales bacterium]|nr:maleylpyruvate isomerase N-terminal domain-containing protein [Candidatus Acidoferrales bacterium]
MTDQQVKPQLRHTVEAARDKERVLAELCDDTPAGVDGRWTAKDHVAHLSSWREHAARVLDAAVHGEDLAEDFEIDTENARTYATYRDSSPHDVLAAASASYDQLLAAIDATTETVLQRKRKGRPGSVWMVVPGNGHAHVGQHVSQWQLEQGDENAAVQTALWVHGLDLLFTDSHSQAVADYNLACFYARAGRAEDAIPLLRASLEKGDASLTEWAREDTDLTGIRDRPEVIALLGA